MTRDPRAGRLGVAAGALVLALLAWQGHHLARWLPQFERSVESLGPWGPLLFCVSILVLQPFLVPDSLFGLAAGATFGLAAGAAYYFVTVYLLCLGLHWLGRHWLKDRVLRMLEARPRLRILALEAPREGKRFTFLVRLIPINPALVSYALGAIGVSLRDAAAGNVAMFAHMLPAVYFGAAAVRMTRMAETGHRDWTVEGVLLMVGLAACVFLARLVSQRARAALEAGRGDAEHAETG